MEAIAVLKQCTVEGHVIKLPEGQLNKEDYGQVKKKLELIGGKWKGGKVYGFEFKEDPTELLQQIANGDARNLKKEYQFFGTPEALADRLVDMADITEGLRILEPQAGQGAIVRSINKVIGDTEVSCYELMPLNQTFLKKIPNVKLLGDDFLLAEPSARFDRIIANPPFSKNQDIDHIRKMYDLLDTGGRLVTIASKHWQNSSNKKEIQFRNWLDDINASVEEIEAGAFKESGTNISAVIITIDKRA